MKKKRINLKKVLIGAGTCVGGLVVYSVGYIAGERESLHVMTNGIGKLWKANPELKTMMLETAEKINS